MAVDRKKMRARELRRGNERRRKEDIGVESRAVREGQVHSDRRRGGCS